MISEINSLRLMKSHYKMMECNDYCALKQFAEDAYNRLYTPSDNPITFSYYHIILYTKRLPTDERLLINKFIN